MRRTCLDMVYKLALQDERIFFVGSDLGFETMKEFHDNIPERFIMEGINEAHAVGLAAGLAMDGKVVYLNTIATFLIRRSYEQVIIDLCMHNAAVRLIGNGGGLVYAPLGATHLAFEDIAAARAVPNMTILAPADADEMRRLMPLTIDHPGPMYIRLAKGYDPIVTSDKVRLAIGKGVPMRQGRDALIVTTGITLIFALTAARCLAGEGIEVAVLHLPTIKPMDVETLLEMADPVRMIVTIEEHSIIGGLGSAVAEVLVDHDALNTKKLKRIALPDVFPEKYGSQATLLNYYGIDSPAIENAIRNELMPSKKKAVYST
jgi:transketolase